MGGRGVGGWRVEWYRYTKGWAGVYSGTWAGSRFRHEGPPAVGAGSPNGQGASSTGDSKLGWTGLLITFVHERLINLCNTGLGSV